MGRSRAPKPKVVRIKVTGWETRPVVLTTQKGVRWIDLLNANWDCQLTRDSNVYIQVSRRPGRTANIWEKIGTLLDTYAKRRNLYCVFVKRGEASNSGDESDSDRGPANVHESSTRLTDNVQYRLRKFAQGRPLTPAEFRKMVTKDAESNLASSGGERYNRNESPIPGTSTQGCSQSAMNAVESLEGKLSVPCPSQLNNHSSIENIKTECFKYDEVEEEGSAWPELASYKHENCFEGDATMEPVPPLIYETPEESQDDNNSVVSVFPGVGDQDVAALREEGQRIKLNALKKLDGSDESYLRGVRKEFLQVTRRREVWTRCMKRSPLACYILRELFRSGAQ